MADVYKEHPSRTCRFVDGTLVPLPDSAEANATVWFALPAAAGEDQVWEGLLAYRPHGSDRAQLRAVPLFAHDLNYGDDVAVMASAEDALVATRVLADNGNYTFRVWCEEGDASVMSGIVSEFGRLGCYIEGYGDRLVGISCDRAAAQNVAHALSTGEQNGRFVYETGRQRTR